MNREYVPRLSEREHSQTEVPAEPQADPQGAAQAWILADQTVGQKMRDSSHNYEARVSISCLWSVIVVYVEQSVAELTISKHLQLRTQIICTQSLCCVPHMVLLQSPKHTHVVSQEAVTAWRNLSVCIQVKHFGYHKS